MQPYHESQSQHEIKEMPKLTTNQPPWERTNGPGGAINLSSVDMPSKSDNDSPRSRTRLKRRRMDLQKKKGEIQFECIIKWSPFITRKGPRINYYHHIINRDSYFVTMINIPDQITQSPPSPMTMRRRNKVEPRSELVSSFFNTRISDHQRRRWDSISQVLKRCWWSHSMISRLY